MRHLGTETLSTGRLILRRFTEDDAEAMYENWASDEEVTKYLMWPAHRDVSVSRELLREWAGNYVRPDYYQWAIVPKGNGDRPVGSIAVVACSEKTQSVHIGYCIGRQWWRRGITSEALACVMDFLFDRVGVQRVDCRHDSRNPHSGDVMRKCGMKYEGTLRQSDWNNQGLCDACYYALLASERAEARNSGGKPAAKHFCSCPVTNCPRHPSKHGEGCDPCVKDNLLKKKMPACMFRAVREDVSEVRDYSIKGFVDFYQRCQNGARAGEEPPAPVVPKQ